MRVDVIFSQPNEISSSVFRHTVDIIHSMTHPFYMFRLSRSSLQPKLYDKGSSRGHKEEMSSRQRRCLKIWLSFPRVLAHLYYIDFGELFDD